MHLLHVTFAVSLVMTIAPFITTRKHWLQRILVPFTRLTKCKSGMFPMMYKVLLFYHQKDANLADVRQRNVDRYSPSQHISLLHHQFYHRRALVLQSVIVLRSLPGHLSHHHYYQPTPTLLFHPFVHLFHPFVRPSFP
ncbi:hypothetical protein Ddye_003241 [Dipteronia dyeriana]|uniref:Uncharacterized protein n=1 Tax=Dipteronia dyeriana TaxID=168575 RepID=A0AAD9XT37_9ROSI|nr:hypothetical protein Ddye_003241 [Dipteronia dyeriana]